MAEDGISSITFAGSGEFDPAVQNYRESVRVVVQPTQSTTALQITATGNSNDPFVNYRESLRVGGTRGIEVAQQFFYADGPAGNDPFVNYRQSIRVAGPRIIETTTLIRLDAVEVPKGTMRYWSGTRWLEGIVRYYDGTTWQDSIDVRTWNGSSWT